MPVVKSSLALTLAIILACVLSLGMAVAVLVPAADPRMDDDDSPAHQLLADVARAYQHLDAYSDQGEFQLATTINGQAGSERSPLKLSFERPNKVRLDAGQVLVVSDGTNLNTSVVPFRKYTVEPAPKTLTFEMFQQGPLGSLLFGGPSARPMFVLLNLLMGRDPVKSISEAGGVLSLEGDRMVDGVSCKVLRCQPDQAAGLRLLIDPQTKLLHAIDLVYDPTELVQKGIQDQVSVDRLGWKAGSVATKDLPADTFAFEPPKGFTKGESIARALGLDKKSPAEEFIGKPSPNFTLNVLDGPGKTRTITRDEMAGKVVAINFWATWCEPCLIELPEIQKVIENYAREKKDVLIVALNQDDEPSDLVDLRSRVERVLEENKIKLIGTPVGLLGLDPSLTVHDAFKIDGLPTTILIDAKGIVQEVHVGVPKENPGEVSSLLSKSIDALLEGKSLAPAAGEAVNVAPEKPGS
jgi:thiol-disulfide isomerase/thioredoxin